MEEKIICTCPNCGANILETQYYYECENISGDCKVKIPKNFFGVEITEEMVKAICNHQTTDTYEFKNNSTGKEWKAKLKYSDEEGKIIFVFEDTNHYIGQCPVANCGGRIKETKKFYLCENYKKNCNTLIAKEIHGHKVTEEEAMKLLNGETLEAEFTWDNGKSTVCSFKLNEQGKVQYIF